MRYCLRYKQIIQHNKISLLLLLPCNMGKDVTKSYSFSSIINLFLYLLIFFSINQSINHFFEKLQGFSKASFSLPNFSMVWGLDFDLEVHEALFSQTSPKFMLSDTSIWSPSWV